MILQAWQGQIRRLYPVVQPGPGYSMAQVAAQKPLVLAENLADFRERQA